MMSDKLLINPEPEKEGDKAMIDKKQFQYSREVPYDVNVEDLLTELLEYMEDRQDVEDGDYGQPKPNKEMRLATDIHQALYQLERQAVSAPVKPSYSEDEVKEIALEWCFEYGFDEWWEKSNLNKSKK